MAHSRSQIAPNLMSEEFQKAAPPVTHSLIRILPETGEKMFHVGAYASHILGWPVDQGRHFLKDLLEWSTQPQFVFQHEWQAHDLVMWDNRYCLHRGRPWDFGRFKRVMHRTTLLGH